MIIACPECNGTIIAIGECGYRLEEDGDSWWLFHGVVTFKCEEDESHVISKEDQKELDQHFGECTVGQNLHNPNDHEIDTTGVQETMREYLSSQQQ